MLVKSRSWGFDVSEDLNTHPREISPVWGNFHGPSVTAGACRRQAFRVASCFLGRAVIADGNGEQGRSWVDGDFEVPFVASGTSKGGGGVLDGLVRRGCRPADELHQVVASGEQLSASQAGIRVGDGGGHLRGSPEPVRTPVWSETDMSW